MLSTGRLLDMARKWKRIAALGRKRIASNRRNSNAEAHISSKIVADKDHFIVYTSEGKRFMLPLTFLRSIIFEELLRMSEEEFGLPGDGPITLPCDATFLEFVLPILRRRISEEMQREFLRFIFTRYCSTLSFQDVIGHCQQLIVC